MGRGVSRSGIGQAAKQTIGRLGGTKPVQVVTEISKTRAAQPVVTLGKATAWVAKPTEAKVQAALGNMLQEGVSATVLDENPDARAILERMLKSAGSGYLASGPLGALFTGGMKLTGAGYRQLTRMVQSANPKTPAETVEVVNRALTQLSADPRSVVRMPGSTGQTSGGLLRGRASGAGPLNGRSQTPGGGPRSPVGNGGLSGAPGSGVLLGGPQMPGAGPLSTTGASGLGGGAPGSRPNGGDGGRLSATPAEAPEATGRGTRDGDHPELTRETVELVEPTAQEVRRMRLRLRRKSPSKATRDRVIEGQTHDFITGWPFQPGQVVTADHLVPLDAIVRMPGFGQLNEAQQLELLDWLPNLRAVSKNMNSSRQEKPFAIWRGHSKLGSLTPWWRQELVELETDLAAQFREMIRDRVYENTLRRPQTPP